MKLVVRLDRVLSDRNLTQKELAEMTGLRPASISELYNNQRKSLNREHIEKIAEALNIKNISELVELKEGDR
ncbi:MULTISPECIES: helix-turn-helix domain-containing protein [Heyndrickxia]|uniref:helix-turn-helix domain-containing protein n=1 Tax=Heyndrickxia TaxID=2837504 RepID=UPI00030C2A9D|nr:MULTISPECIES: helix-turn-helix transcriptional regulator [Heyndrickxia]MED4892703.1 helix-turn-helix transcriptional regulator [Weizmannia sp. CD-2023]